MGDPREPLEETRPAPTELGPDSVLISGESAQVVRNVLAKSAPGGERYRLLELLGRGAMGEVYLAVDTVLGREVAVKFASDPRRADLALRFLTEVQVTGGLDHPGVVRVHDFDVDREGRPFFTMKRIRGEPWSELLQKQSLQDRLEVFQRVAEAVAHAHSRGVLHRDLKPANVLVGEYGEVVVADWGLAKILDKAGGLPPGRQDGAGGSGPPAGGGEAPAGRSGGQGWPARRSVSRSRRGAPRRARPAPPR
ncbi:MAG: serine/threonine protein kinase, partial [Planctomycetes bacterium]|nr:serine/threonine protein kinase [Planctomycetota bacterium]